MDNNILNLNLDTIPTPIYIIDEELLENNLKILRSVIDKTGCKILLAQKAFSMYSTYPLIAKYLSGTTASSLHEARLGYEEMGNEVHIYAPAYGYHEFDQILNYADHIVFNSLSQWEQFKDKVHQSPKKISCGLRINPEYSEIEVDLYNPCFPCSRFGIKSEDFVHADLSQIEGLHFHSLCEQDADVLDRTLNHVEEKFGKYLYHMKWMNFGGGHHITKKDYDLELLIHRINYFQNKYQLKVYLEPGEAIAYKTGYLISNVLDTMHNQMDIAILDTSAACHMPDVIEMPYRPDIINSGKANEYPYTYRLGGPTCLAGDVIGDYSFEQPLKSGDKLIFCDMAIYSMVKNNTFNGMNLPCIGLLHKDQSLEIIKQFGYEDFKSRL